MKKKPTTPFQLLHEQLDRNSDALEKAVRAICKDVGKKKVSKKNSV